MSGWAKNRRLRQLNVARYVVDFEIKGVYVAAQQPAMLQRFSNFREHCAEQRIEDSA